MTKKIAIIGRGTAGSLSVIHFLRHMNDCEIEWHYDPNVPVQSVGEGSTPQLPKSLYENLNFNYLDSKLIDSTVKTGIYKSGWGQDKKDFLHQFPPPTVALHFNAVSLQNYILDKVKNKVSIFEHSVTPDDIDADFVMDCSGRPKSYEKFHDADFIPVNSAYVTQCYWDRPRFYHTLTIARPYGWVFGVPLQNRCSIGYLYNKDINSLEEVKEDVKNVFERYELIPSNDTNTLSFNNYYRKQNYTERVCYNGNASFFLEPMEATSIGTMDRVQRYAFDIWNKNISFEMANQNYLNFLSQIETTIMLHYFAGSKYKTKFWEFAQQKGKDCINLSLKYDDNFSKITNYSIKMKKRNLCDPDINYGYWGANSLCENIYGLGIEKSLLELVKKYD